MYLKWFKVGWHFSECQFAIFRFAEKIFFPHLNIKEIFEPNEESEQMFNAFKK